MIKMNRAIIIPIIALVALFLQRMFGVEWSDQDMQTINDGVLSITILLGILMNPKKEE